MLVRVETYRRDRTPHNDSQGLNNSNPLCSSSEIDCYYDNRAINDDDDIYSNKNYWALNCGFHRAVTLITGTTPRPCAYYDSYWCVCVGGGGVGWVGGEYVGATTVTTSTSVVLLLLLLLLPLLLLLLPLLLQIVPILLLTAVATTTTVTATTITVTATSANITTYCCCYYCFCFECFFLVVFFS